MTPFLTNKTLTHSQGEVVEAHGPQSEGPGQETHVCEQNPDGVLEGGQLLEDRGRLDQLPVRLRLLDLEKTGQMKWLGDDGVRLHGVGSFQSKGVSTIIWSDSVQGKGTDVRGAGLSDKVRFLGLV